MLGLYRIPLQRPVDQKELSTPPIPYDGKINVATIDSIQTSVSRRIRLRWKILIDENGFSACCFDTSPGCFSILFESFDHGAYENARTSISFVHR